MNKAKLIYTSLFCVTLLFFASVSMLHTSTDEQIKNFFDSYGIKDKDISYASASLSVQNNNIILYQTSVNALLAHHKVDKIIISKKDGNILVQLDGVHINVIESLNLLYKDTLFDKLATYNPVTDAIVKPLQSLALMGIDSFNCNITFKLNTSLNESYLTGRLTSNITDIDFALKLKRENTSSLHNSLIYALHGTIQAGSFTLTDKGIIDLYNTYLQGVYTKQRPDLLKKDATYKAKTQLNIPITHIYK